jgi:hypothetical protein
VVYKNKEKIEIQIKRRKKPFLPFQFNIGLRALWLAVGSGARCVSVGYLETLVAKKEAKASQVHQK